MSKNTNRVEKRAARELSETLDIAYVHALRLLRENGGDVAKATEQFHREST